MLDRRPAQLHRLGPVLGSAGIFMQKAMAQRVASGEPDQILVVEHAALFPPRGSALPTGQQALRGDQEGYTQGQLVVYSICKPRRGLGDLDDFVRNLEEALIRTASDFGVAARRRLGDPGIWVGGRRLGEVRAQLRPQVTTSSLVLNVASDLPLAPQSLPRDSNAVCLQSLLGDGGPSWDEAADHLEGHLAQVLGLDLLPAPPPCQSISATTWRSGREAPEVLVMLRQPQEGLWWSSVTGMVDPGESLEEAAIREVKEETGLEGILRPLGFAHSFFADPHSMGIPVGEPHFHRETCFHMEVSPEAVVDLNLGEHSTYRWCGLDEAERLVLWDGAKEGIRRLAHTFPGQ